MNINNCKFKQNYYNNHGATLHYSSEDSAQLTLVINNCTFEYNKGASIEYFHHFGISQHYLCLKNSTFKNNQGVSVYILNFKSTAFH